jgi:hypothetical protein
LEKLPGDKIFNCASGESGVGGIGVFVDVRVGRGVFVGAFVFVGKRVFVGLAVIVAD